MRGLVQQRSEYLDRISLEPFTADEHLRQPPGRPRAGLAGANLVTGVGLPSHRGEVPQLQPLGPPAGAGTKDEHHCGYLRVAVPDLAPGRFERGDHRGTDRPR